MAITRIKNSTISNRTPKYNDVLAGLPFRPIIGTASDGGNGTSASVAFTGNNVANGTITYTALSSPGSFTGTGTASPITVSGLTAGTAYTFQVKAGNSLGDSAYSAASNSVTPVTPSSFESIATATGTGSSNTITFSSIPGTYQHLQIRCLMRDTLAANASSELRIRVNSDTGSNYTRHYLRGDGSTAAAAGFSNTSALFLEKSVPLDSVTSNTMGVAIVDIHDYANTSKNKTIRAISGVDANTASTEFGVVLSSSVWMNTNAITSISLSTIAANWTTTTQFALYGIKGA